MAPTLYADIAAQLAAEGLNRQDGGELGAAHHREAVRPRPGLGPRTQPRPARRTSHEDQIYRIDHYLGKDTVQNVLVFRFANTLFEPVWNYNYIDHVQITVSETVTSEAAATTTTSSGVLRDMFQNHLLQVLTLVAMEAPARFTADPLRNEKVKVLDAIPVLTPEEAAKRIVAGQYAGYRSEKGVAPDSQTPTYAAIELSVDNWRWRGVPFYLRSGKGLKRRRSEVVIQFRCPPHLMFPLPPGATLAVQPADDVHPARRGHPPELPEQGARRRLGGRCGRPTWSSTTSEAYPDAPLPESYERLLHGRHRTATPTCSCAATRSSGPGRSWTRSSRRSRAASRQAAGVRGRLGRAVLRRRVPGAGGPGVAAAGAGEVNARAG